MHTFPKPPWLEGATRNECRLYAIACTCWLALPIPYTEPNVTKRNPPTSMTNIRIVPIQQLWVLCGDELPARDAAQGLAGWLCRACIRLLSERVFFRELEQQPKIVRV